MCILDHLHDNGIFGFSSKYDNKTSSWWFLVKILTSSSFCSSNRSVSVITTSLLLPIESLFSFLWTSNMQYKFQWNRGLTNEARRVTRCVCGTFHSTLHLVELCTLKLNEILRSRSSKLFVTTLYYILLFSNEMIRLGCWITGCNLYLKIMFP